jgi:hypothetical protein
MEKTRAAQPFASLLLPTWQLGHNLNLQNSSESSFYSHFPMIIYIILHLHVSLIIYIFKHIHVVRGFPRSPSLIPLRGSPPGAREIGSCTR